MQRKSAVVKGSGHTLHVSRSKWPPLMLWPYLAELSFPNERKPEICGFPAFNFHGKESWRAAASCSAGSLRKRSRSRRSTNLPARRVAQATQNRRNTKNPLAERLGFFVWSLSALGSKRGEQPLFHGSSALKSLVVFWFSFATKREHTRRRCILQKA